MMNYIWFGMMVIGVVVGIFTGRIEAVTQAAIDMAKVSVEIAIGLIGIMALWLGVMKIAEESGLISLIARAVKPIMVRLFPDVPADHPAMGSIVLNMSANMLGLGNAATPLGLKAMEELQELNPEKGTAGGGADGRRVQPDFHPDHTCHHLLDGGRDRGGEVSREAQAIRAGGGGH